MRAPTAARRVLILTASFGSGHVRAAQAIAAATRAADPGADVRVVDLLAASWWLFRVIYVWPYWVMLRVRPVWWRALYTRRHNRAGARTAPAWLFRVGCSRVFSQLRAFAPDVIVATEVSACEVAAMARKHGDTRAPVVAVITDHHGERAWVSDCVATYAVADANVASQLADWGVPDDRLTIWGYRRRPRSGCPSIPPRFGSASACRASDRSCWSWAAEWARRAWTTSRAISARAATTCTWSPWRVTTAERSAGCARSAHGVAHRSRSSDGPTKLRD